MSAHSPTAPPARIGSASDIERARAFAFSALAAGDPLPALRWIDNVEADEDWHGAWFELVSEVHVRAGIALGDEDLVQDGLEPPAFLFDDDAPSHDPEPRAMLVRGIGAQWMLERIERECGAPARFTHGRAWLAVARWGLARTLALEDLDPDQRAEGAAALDRIYLSAGRFLDAADAIAAARDAPASLRPARDALRAARKAGISDEARSVFIHGAMHVIAKACEPSWPVLGGPWWVSDMCGLCIDVSAPSTAAERHRFALADALLELDDLPAAIEPDDARMRALDAHRLSIADGALGHAVRSGLAG